MNKVSESTLKIGAVLAASAVVIYFLSHHKGDASGGQISQTQNPADTTGLTVPTTTAGSTGTLPVDPGNITYNIGAGGDSNLPVFDPSKFLLPNYVDYNSPENQIAPSFLQKIFGAANSGGSSCGCGCGPGGTNEVAKVADPVALAQAYAPALDDTPPPAAPAIQGGNNYSLGSIAQLISDAFTNGTGSATRSQSLAERRGTQTINFGQNGLPSLGNQNPFGDIPVSDILLGQAPDYNRFLPTFNAHSDLELHYFS